MSGMKSLLAEVADRWHCLEWTWNTRKRNEYGFAGVVRGPFISFAYFGPVEVALWHN